MMKRAGREKELVEKGLVGEGEKLAHGFNRGLRENTTDHPQPF
jgi:hypothetical protein